MVDQPDAVHVGDRVHALPDLVVVWVVAEVRRGAATLHALSADAPARRRTVAVGALRHVVGGDDPA